MIDKAVSAICIFSILAAGLVITKPATAACVMATNSTYSTEQKRLLVEARSRITASFGTPESEPTIYFFERTEKFWPLTLNPYASTSYLGYKTCIAIGPRGQNIDVIAHELMHAEIEHRIGFLTRSRQLPVWFDEGLAMQVDFRDRYDFSSEKDTSYVTQLVNAREFFNSEQSALIRNYSAAKAEVHGWLDGQGSVGVYDVLDKLKQGEAFESVWQSDD